MMKTTAIFGLLFCVSRLPVHLSWSSPTTRRRGTSLPKPSAVTLAPQKTITTAIIASSIILSAPFHPSHAADYASKAVQTAITELKDAHGTADATVKAYENIAEIITEGKGVGGLINFQGIQLERGYVADEDTTMYNPGLSLLTESEKNQLVAAIVDSKATATTEINAWNVDTDAGFRFLLEKLDPFHMYELKGYLSIVPIYGAVVYLAVLAVQQLARDVFPAAYVVGALAIFAPAVVLVLLGPT